MADGQTREEFNSIFNWAMALEDQMHADGRMNDSAFRCREITNWATRNLTVIQDGAAERIVLKNIIDERTPNGQLVMPAGLDGRAAIDKLLSEAKPHWGPPAPASDLASLAFGLDGTKPNLTMQGRYIREECGGSAELAAARAKEFGTSLGSDKPGTRPASDNTGKPLPPAADAVRKNPWLTEPKDAKNPNDPVMVRRLGIIKGMGTKAAAGLAKAARKSISGAPLRF
jgi:hypothetical protein